MKYAILTGLFLFAATTMGCSKTPEPSGHQPFSEAASLICPENTKRIEDKTSSYPEYYCVGENGKQGTWLQFDVNGRLRIRTQYVDDHQNGIWTQYHADGSTDTVGQMKDDMRIGEWKQYYVNGKPRSIKHYEASQLTGRVELFYQEGSLMAEGDYQADFEEGPWKVYTPEGKLARECRMEHGMEKDCVIHIKDFQPSTFRYNSKDLGAL